MVQNDPKWPTIIRKIFYKRLRSTNQVHTYSVSLFAPFPEIHEKVCMYVRINIWSAAQLIVPYSIHQMFDDIGIDTKSRKASEHEKK